MFITARVCVCAHIALYIRSFFQGPSNSRKSVSASTVGNSFNLQLPEFVPVLDYF